MDLGFLTDSSLADNISKQLAVERINLQNTYIDAAAARLIPKEIAKKYSMIPVYERDGALYVAMSDPRNMYALDDLRLITQKPIRPLIASSSEIERAIEIYYSQQSRKGDRARDWTVESGDSRRMISIFRCPACLGPTPHHAGGHAARERHSHRAVRGIHSWCAFESTAPWWKSCASLRICIRRC